MSRNLTPGTLIILISIMTKIASAQIKPAILLSNHTFSSGNHIIGNISLPGYAGNFKLIGENAKLFNLKNSRLSIRKKYVQGDSKWYDLVLVAESGSGRIEQSFKIVRDDFNKNRVIAHRGAWKNTGAPENSISALQHAVRLGCRGTEFDVHMTLDSNLIVNHDPSFKGKFIASSTFFELKQLKLSNGEYMPGLGEYLEEGMKQNSTKLVLEIKPTISKERAIQSAQKVYELVKKMKAQAWVDYISFDYNICLELLRLDPYARVAYLNGDKAPGLLAADNLWGLDYNQSVFQKNPGWIQEAKAMGLTINAWTVNDPKLLQWFLDQKLDFITTNEPELLLKMVQK